MEAGNRGEKNPRSNTTKLMLQMNYHHTAENYSSYSHSIKQNGFDSNLFKCVCVQEKKVE